MKLTLKGDIFSQICARHSQATNKQIKIWWFFQRPDIFEDVLAEYHKLQALIFITLSDRLHDDDWSKALCLKDPSFCEVSLKNFVREYGLVATLLAQQSSSAEGGARAAHMRPSSTAAAARPSSRRKLIHTPVHH